MTVVTKAIAEGSRNCIIGIEILLNDPYEAALVIDLQEQIG